MATKSIGFVVDLIGNAQVRSVDGVIRVLSIGDKINDGDILTTGLGTKIALEFYNGQRLQAGENTEMLLDESVFASLQSYSDDRVDQLAELQSLIIEGIDLADLEATAAGPSAAGPDGLHQASVYSRDGNEGLVETRVTPFNTAASDPDNQSLLDGANFFAAEDSTSNTTGAPEGPVSNNERPVAMDDAITAIEDTPFNSTIELLANDIDLDGDTLSVLAGTFTTTQGGSIAIAADGSYTYTPALNFNGTDSVDYTVTDGSMTDVGTLTITVNSVNDAPVALDDAITAIEDTPFTSTIDLDFNDTDLDGDALTVVAGTFATTQGGSITIAADGSYTYTPALNFNGTDTVDYTVTDGSLSDVGTLSINVSAVNNAPDALDDPSALDGPEDSTSGSLNATMLSNDSDLDGDTLSIIEINGTALTGAVQSIAVTNGTVNIDAGGNITFSADSNYNGPVSFNYTISDGTLTDTATVDGIISPVNDTATVSADTGIVQEDDAATLTTSGSVVITDTDAGEALAQPQVNTTGTFGTFSVDANGNWDYQADNSQAAIQQLGATDSLTETFTVVSQDGSASNTVTITINGTNDTATVSADTGSVTEDAAATLTTSGSVTITDTDAGEALAQPQVNTAGTYGTFSVDANGNWDYQADNSQAAIQQLGATDSLTETFTVVSQDGSASNTVTITINGSNDVATVSADTGSVTEDAAATLTTSGSVTITDTDAGEALAQPQINTAGTYGTFSVDANGNWDYQADNSQTAIQQLGATDSLTETFTVVSQDGSASNTVTITINGTNDGPVIDLDGNDSTAPGTGYTTSLTEGGSAAYIADTDINITDVDGTALTGATITINSVESGDLLAVGALPAGITAAAYDPSTGTITLSGSASLADYQDAIRAIQFSNDGSTVNTSRSIDVVVTDGVNSSNSATTAITINTLPTVSVTDVSVQEPAAGTTALTFTISIDQTLGSDLTFDYQTADISALAGADFVGISSTVGTITAGSTSTTVTVTVNSDANVFEGDETLSLDLTNFNQTVNFDAAANIISGGVQGIGTIGANNGAPVAVDDSYITTVDTPLVVTNALANDTLVDNARVDVSGYTDLGSGLYSFNATNGSVVYDSNSGNFTFTPNSGYACTAGFSYTLIDDDGETDTASVSVDVSSVVVNPPVVTNVPDTAYTENDSPVSLMPGISISDVDSTNLSSVVVTVDGFIGSQDVLDYLTAGYQCRGQRCGVGIQLGAHTNRWRRYQRI